MSKRKEIFVDLETTGLNPSRDKIVQIGMILPDGSEFESLVNPERPIPAETTAIHGITNEMVKDSPTITDLADQVITALEDADVFVAYNFTFDFQVLQQELFKSVQYDLKETDFAFIDPYKIFRKMFPHTLSNAYKFYTGKTLEGAHSAIHDIRATKAVLEKQEEEYPELFQKTPEEIARYTIGDTTILGKWFEAVEGGYRFKQGKHRGEIASIQHEKYMKWILSLEDITLSEKRYINSLLSSRV